MQVLVEGVSAVKAVCPHCGYEFIPRKKDAGGKHKCSSCGKRFALWLPSDIHTQIDTRPTVKKQIELKQLSIEDIMSNEDFHDYWSTHDDISVEGYLSWHDSKR